MTFDQTITQAVTRILTTNNYPLVDFSLDHPVDPIHGDYACNVAMLLFPKMKNDIPTVGAHHDAPLRRDRPISLQDAPVPIQDYQNPRELADLLKAELFKDESLSTIVDHIEVAGPGFINFYLKTSDLVKELAQITTKADQYGTNDLLLNKKILVEYTDPNPFKEFHIGHLYSNTVGETLARILGANGAEIRRANYQGDVGMHVAKSLWGLKQKLNIEQKQLSDLEPLSTEEKVAYLGQSYAMGATAYEEDENAKNEIKDINAAVYHSDPQIMDMYQKGKQWSLDYFETIYKRLGTKFDYYFFKSNVGPLGLQFVKEQLAKGVFEKSDGAIVFKGEQYGLHTRVFVNAQDLPTYEAKDLGLSVIKYAQYPYDLSIIITANEIDEYFKVILKVLNLIRPDLASKTKHLSHGVVKLPEGKMSSRTGKIITGEKLLQTVKDTALSVMNESKNEFTDFELEKISEQIAVGAIKYAFLKSALGKDIIYDINASLSLSGNSGPYIQYTYARCVSVLNKAKGNSSENSEHSESQIIRQSDYQKSRKTYSDLSENSDTPNFRISEFSECSELCSENYSFNPEELSLLRYLYRFPEVVAQAGAEFAPHILCTYLYELAQKFNTFYNMHSILGKGDRDREGNNDKLQMTNYKSNLNDKYKNSKQENNILSSTLKPSNNQTIEPNNHQTIQPSNSSPLATSYQLPATSPLRLALTQATAQVLNNGLNLLGIQAPERM